jgi:hypothetical protein
VSAQPAPQTRTAASLGEALEMIRQARLVLIWVTASDGSLRAFPVAKTKAIEGLTARGVTAIPPVQLSDGGNVWIG